MISRRMRVFTCTLGVLAIAGLTISYFAPETTDSAHTLNYQTVAESMESKNIFKPTLVDDLNIIIADNDGLEIAISVVDLESGNQYDAGESETQFRAASVTKIITASAYLHEVEIGNATLEQRIGGTPANKLIEQMLTVSDNTAWYTLTDYLGSKQDTFAHSMGLSSFSYTPLNTISATDTAKLLTLLNQNKLLSQSNTNLLLSYMEKANGTDLIKSALPSEAISYHKYGMLFGNLHDTAIVTYKGQSFALVVFTKSPDDTTDDYSKRVQLIHQITQAVLNNLTN